MIMFNVLYGESVYRFIWSTNFVPKDNVSAESLGIQ